MTFSLDLSDEVIHVRDWVHEFAADVVRPGADTRPGPIALANRARAAAQRNIEMLVR